MFEIRHIPQLDEAMDVWAHDTHALLDACVALVSYFGADEEDASIEKVAPTLHAWVDVVQRWREHRSRGFHGHTGVRHSPSKQKSWRA